MGKLQDFLMNAGASEKVTKEVYIQGFPEPFQIQSITEAEHKALRRGCQKTTFNKKTHQRTTETDTDLYNDRLVIACTVDPNFKDAQLQARYGVMGAEDLLGVLFSPGQFLDLLLAIQELIGITGDVNDLMEEAKN